MISIISFILFSIAILTVILFQFALALGKPWGEYSMGGKFKGEYPPKMKVVAVINALILIFLEFIVIIKMNLILSEFSNFANVAIWFVVIFTALGTKMNFITPSKKERKIWGPVSLLMLITSLLIALR
jgi:hypothetical protein